jgi:hypothetical protein
MVCYTIAQRFTTCFLSQDSRDFSEIYTDQGLSLAADQKVYLGDLFLQNIEATYVPSHGLGN